MWLTNTYRHTHRHIFYTHSTISFCTVWLTRIFLLMCSCASGWIIDKARIVALHKCTMCTKDPNCHERQTGRGIQPSLSATTNALAWRESAPTVIFVSINRVTLGVTRVISLIQRYCLVQNTHAPIFVRTTVCLSFAPRATPKWTQG